MIGEYFDLSFILVRNTLICFWNIIITERIIEILIIPYRVLKIGLDMRGPKLVSIFSEVV